jgi:hypothetical protein
MDKHILGLPILTHTIADIFKIDEQLTIEQLGWAQISDTDNSSLQTMIPEDLIVPSTTDLDAFIN